jgi:tetratricopeptide (TPR) repeat protein
VRRLLLALLLVPAAATADVWQRASDRGAAAARRAAYDAKLAAGDDLALAADARSIAATRVRQLVDDAVETYRAAAVLEPTEGEPYYRIGRVLYSFYFECTDESLMRRAQSSPLCDPHPARLDRKRAKDVIDAWDAFEARAPLDPRLSVDPPGESEILFKRAILHTKLATTDELTAAANDYEKYLARGDGSGLSNETVWSNLAETYMMLGRLDEAVDTYREALHRGGGVSTQYGLAVALDRDGRGEEAKDRIAQLGEVPFREFRNAVNRNVVFYVPQGEVYYYFALADETFGQYDEALEMWRLYIRSNAHPQFQPRAKAHIDWINAERKKHPVRVAPPPLPEEMPY